MSQEILHQVQEKYGSVARSKLSSENVGVRAVAEAFGYSAEELEGIPAEANMGLSCGNPTAWASLRSGEVVVDLGCGGGLDVFLAAIKVGPEGKAIGIDMTPEMIERARQNARQPIQGKVLTNVEFHEAKISQLPLATGSVDCVISNCVLNLVPDKKAAFREIYRVLKPGGRLAVSDIALRKSLPEDIAQNVLAYIGCIAGAILIEDYRAGLTEAGFQAVKIIDTRKDLNAYAKIENQAGCCGSPVPTPASLPMAGCCAPPLEEMQQGSAVHQALVDLFRKYNVNEYAASVQVYAVKTNEIGRPRRVLFVCVENSNRSQMAEAFARMHGQDGVEAYSAGSRPGGRVNSRAIEFMGERGYNLSRHKSKGIAEIPEVEFDAVISMGCGEECPVVRTKRREDWVIPDPKELPQDQFRVIRDLIEEKVKNLLARL